MGSKKASALLGLLLASTAGAAVLFQAAVPNLQAYYDFEGVVGTTVLDKSGNTNTGTLMSGGAVIQALAPTVPTGNASSVQITQAAANARMQVPHNPALAFTSRFTIAAWVRPTSYPGAQLGIIEKWDWTGSNINGYFIRLSSTGTPHFSIGYGPTQISATAGPVLPLNVWTHVAGVYDGTNMLLYVGGGTPRATAASLPPQASTAPLHIGADYGGNRFQGNIDEVRLFDRNLSQAEIGVLINGMAAPTLTSLTSPEGNQLLLTWTAVSGASSYSVYRSTSPGTTAIPANLVATVPGTSYLDTTVLNPQRYYYVVVANGVMSSGVSNELDEVPMSIQPRYNDHEEGTRDRECACGSAAPGAPFLLLLAALFAAALAPRRRRGL